MIEYFNNMLLNYFQIFLYLLIFKISLFFIKFLFIKKKHFILILSYFNYFIDFIFESIQLNN